VYFNETRFSRKDRVALKRLLSLNKIRDWVNDLMNSFMFESFSECRTMLVNEIEGMLKRSSNVIGWSRHDFVAMKYLPDGDYPTILLRQHDMMQWLDREICECEDHFLRKKY